MLYSDFQKIYDKNIKDLERAAKYLKAELGKILNGLAKRRVAAGLPEHLFRIRLKEVRVKECISLFQKINDDPRLSFDRAFEPRHVHDLIGARIVCHNLCDLKELGECFESYPYFLGNISHAKPETGKKRWIEESQPGSIGYRGWHVDVYWPKGSSEPKYFAEIQIRTLLMDAFASLTHEDGYKGGADLPPDMLAQAREISDLLHLIDKTADRLRINIQSASVSSDSGIKILEADGEAMFFMASFLLQPLGVPRYTSVERKDTFTIDPDNPKFEIEISAKCDNKERFAFPVGGDSPAKDNFSLVSLERANRDGSWVALAKNQYIVEYPQSHVVSIVSKHRPEKNHRYKIVCLWRNIFERSRDYIWAPMNHLYPASPSMTYDLTLRFIKKPRRAPRLFRLHDYDSLREIREEFQAGKGIEAQEVETGHFTFRGGNDNYLCLFEQS